MAYSTSPGTQGYETLKNRYTGTDLLPVVVHMLHVLGQLVLMNER
jgi:hypothetical protein